MRRPKNTKPAHIPKVGIVFLVGDKVWIDSTPLSDAGRFSDHLIHEADHHQYWEHLVSSGVVPDGDYEEHPRGRVAYSTRTGKFTLLADKCILRRKRIVRTILKELHLPASDMETGADSHYRCFRCLARSQ
jgi:hypothetical protein